MSSTLNIQSFEKKPVSILAVQVTPTNTEDIREWILFNGGRASVCRSGVFIKTLEGEMLAMFGDMVIRGTAGEFYPCKKSIFENLHVIPEDFKFDM